MLDRPSLAELFVEFGSRQSRLRELLSPQQLASLKFRRHPLGFAHAVVAQEKEYALRLHVWPDWNRYEQPPFWPIHTHKFDLISHVLMGELTNRLHRVRQSGEVTSHRLYEVAYGADGSAISRTEQYITVETYHSEHVRAASRYAVAAGVFHDTSVPRGIFTATFAITKDCAEDKSIKVVGSANGEVQYTYARGLVDHSEQVEISLRLSEVY